MRVQLPDGKIAEFPDNMDQETIAGILREQYASPKRPIDPRTAMQVPTPQEQIYAGRKLAADMAPIAGDIAFSLAMPEMQAARLGMKAGGLGIKAVNALMRAGAAGTGGALGEYGREKIMGEPTDPRKIGLQAAAGAGGELGGSALIAGGKRVLKPVINWAAEAIKITKPIAQAAIKYQRKLQQKIKENTTGRMLNFVETFSGPPKAEAGKAVGLALKGQMDFASVYKPWTQAIDRIAAENGGVVPLDNAVQDIGELVEKFANNKRSRREAINEAVDWLGFGGSKEKGMIKAIINDIYEDGFMDPKDVKYLMSKLWKGHATKSTAKASNWKEAFKMSFMDDIDKYGFGAAEARRIADQTYGSVKEFMKQSPAASKIMGRMNFGRSDRLYFEELPSKIGENIFGKADTVANMIATKKDPEAIMQLRNFVTNAPDGKETWDAITFSYISDLIRGSIKSAPDTGKSLIVPAELAEKIYQAEDTLRAAVPAGTWNRLKKEADHLLSVAGKFQKLEVSEGYDIFTAFGILSPKSKAVIEKIGKGAAWGGKQAGKATLHLMAAHGSE